jgi:hypothetical protein
MQYILLIFKNGFHRYSIFTFPNPAYFLFIEEILRKIESSTGIAINIIQGTSVMVRINVLPYNGKEASVCPNRKRNNVIDG